MVESSNLGVFGIGDEHCKKRKKNFINKKRYVKVVQVVGFLYMNHRAKYCLEGVFVRGGGGGGAYGILYEISFFFALSSNFYRQLVQYKNTCTTVLSFLCQQLMTHSRVPIIIHIYQFISLFFVKTDIIVIVKP